jgi:hypothetical protein
MPTARLTNATRPVLRRVLPVTACAVAVLLAGTSASWRSTAHVETSAAVPAAQLTLSPNSGYSGTPVAISGSGFPPGEIVAIYIDAAGPYLGNPPPGPRADAHGAIQVSIKWPDKSYDPSGHVDPTVVGPHTVCGDTAYPGSSQRVPTRGCAQFNVVAAPVTPTAAPAPAGNGFPVGEVLVAFVALMLLSGGVLLLTARSDRSKSLKGRG